MSTISKVAERAGVSRTTVSHVINHANRVSKPLREKVQAAIDELGYSPNPQAKSLRTGRTNLIAMLIPDIGNPFYTEMVKAAQEEVAGRIPVMAGIITTSTREAVKRAKIARDAGAQAVMVTPPIYQICSDDGIYDFYSTIHKESGLPIVIYNVLTNAPVTPKLMQRMAANLEETGLIATKESIGGSLETLGELLMTIDDKISVTWAHDWLLYPGLALGAKGSISGAAAILPRHSLALWDALQRSDIATAQKLHFAITDVCSQVSRYNWPAGVKLAVNLQGRKVGPTRAPFNRVPDEQVQRIKDALDRANAIDLKVAA